jgi:hypothetical protein
MRSHARIAAAALGLSAALAVPALAQAPGPAPLVKRLADCRKIESGTERLACYDAAAERLESAERQGEVIVVDREQAQAARRQAFGFNLPSLSVFNRGAPEAEFDRAAYTVAHAQQDSRGLWILRTQEGQVWRQTEAERVRRDPKPGSRLEVRRGALGSYFMEIDGQRPVRALRDR